MQKIVDELVTQAGRVLAELGYAPSTIRRYATTWNKVRRWCSQHGIERFGADQEQHVIQGLGLDGDALSTPGREALRHIRTLLSVDEEGAVPAVSRSAPGVLLGSRSPCIDTCAGSWTRTATFSSAACSSPENSAAIRAMARRRLINARGTAETAY